MKIAVLIARILLGLMFTVFGLNGFFHFLPMQLPPGDAGTLFTIMFKYGWFTFFSLLYVIAGVLLLIGRYIGVALTILGPISSSSCSITSPWTRRGSAWALVCRLA